MLFSVRCIYICVFNGYLLHTFRVNDYSRCNLLTLFISITYKFESNETPTNSLDEIENKSYRKNTY
ncbi:hypothetical protein JCM19376_16950 [Fusibacter bizertensis]